MSDREDFQAARDAGLKARHETRLARAQEIPEGAIKAAAKVIYQSATGTSHHRAAPTGYELLARSILEAALPHLRPHSIEGIKSREPDGEALVAMRKWYADNDLPGPPETREARGIRREVAEEIAVALEAQAAYVTITAVERIPGSRGEAELAGASGGLKLAAHVAREIGSKEAGE